VAPLQNPFERALERSWHCHLLGDAGNTWMEFLVMVSTLRTPRFQGTLTALITPFRNDEIDEIALRALVEFQVTSGVDGLIPCGTTGESVTMTTEERRRVVEIVIDQTGGRVPVIAGTGSNNTRQAIADSRHAQAAGADAALVVVPYYNKPTQAGLIAHYTAIADATDLPVILYNVPGRTGINMSAETTLELAAHPNIAGIKEACGSLDQVSEIVTEAPEGFVTLSGDDSLTLPMMSIGARGVISVASNIVPSAMSALTGACRREDFTRARDIHNALFPLMRAMFIENNPTAVKTAAALLGLCSDEVRLPLTPMSPANRDRVAAALNSCVYTRTPVAA
jgi:4-hydroxy-tetrahydrodipicolinate synthase